MDINLTNPVTTAKIGEVVNGANAATPNDTDLVPIVESSVTKKLTLTNLKAFLKTYFDTLYSALTASSFGTFINGLTGKTTPVDADELTISDSAAANVAKKVTFANLKATLKTYFDTIYTTTSAVATQITTALATFKTDNFLDATSSIQTQLNSKGYVVASRYYATLNPADSTTYFTAYVFASNLTTTGAGTVHKALKSGTSINVGWTHTCTAGSNEGVTLKVTNKTTLVTITITTTIDMSSANVNNSYLAQALTYSAGDQLEVTIETPAWVTNPTSVRFNVDLHLV